MAFANLFTTLSAIGEDVKSPGEPAFTHRNQSENDKRSNGRKRKQQGEQSGPYKKKRCYQEQKMDTYNATSFEYSDSKAMHCHFQNTDSEHASISFTKERLHNHNEKTGHTDMFHKGQHCTAKSNRNVNKQQQERKKTEGQKNLHHLKNKRKNTSRGGHHQARQNSRKGGGDRKHKDGKRDVQAKLTRFMTQEFKDQNALLVDGRLLCRHFLWGRCIKGDDCQLEHIQGYNDLIKEVCKFYIQGFCTKGESCPYMHKSFPCKFFHRKGKCSQGADCRFSHDPLNEVTNRLLDEALKREKDLYELAKKAEQDSLGQTAKTDESEVTDTNTTSDILIQPLRPNFYNSEQTNADQEALLFQAEELANDGEETYPPQTQPHSPPSTELIQEGPVCYSVEAVLGRQHFKPFPSFFTNPQGQESASFPSSEYTSGSVNQSEVPYSVNAFLRSCKSVENSTLGNTPTPPAAQTSTSKTDCEKMTDALLSSEVENKKVLCSVSTRNETSKSQEKVVKSLSSHQVHSGLISKTCSEHIQVSGDHKKQGGEIPESIKPVPSVSHEVKLGLLDSSVSVAEKSSKSKRDMKGSTHLPTDTTCSVNSKSESVLHFAPIKCKNLTCAPKHPTPLKPHVSGLTSKPQALVKPISSSTCFSEFKSRVAVPAEPVTSSDKTADSGNSVSQSAHCTSKDIHIKTAAEPDKAITRSFLSLFAAPLPAAPLPSQSPPHDSRSASCSQESNQSVDGRSHFTDSNQRASDLDTPLHCQVKINERQTSHRPSSPKLSTGLKNENDKSVSQPAEQQVNPACVPPDPLSEMSSSPAPCGNSPDPSKTQSHQQQPGISSHKGSAAATTANSVLKTLFLCLSPYQQEGEQQHGVQISVPSESEKDKSITECVFKTQRKNERTSRRKKMIKTQDSHQQCSDKPVAHSTKHQPPFQTPQISLDASSGLTLCSPAMSQSQVKNSSTHNSPLKAATPLVQHHTRSKLKHTSEEGKCVNGTMAVTPLKDLFKTLDTTVFHFGH